MARTVAQNLPAVKRSYDTPLGIDMEITHHFPEKTLRTSHLELSVAYDFVGTLFPTNIGAPPVLTTAIGVYHPAPVTMPGLVAPVMCDSKT